MPCDICGHTLQKVAGCAETQRTFWCARCGSIMEETGIPPLLHRRTESPSVVRCVRAMHDEGVLGMGDNHNGVEIEFRLLRNALEAIGVKTPGG